MMTFHEFRDFYHNKGYCPNDVSKKPRKNPLTKQKLESKYRAYLRSIGKTDALKERQAETDEEWERVREEVWERDRGMCRLSHILTVQEYEALARSPGWASYTVYDGGVDPAHVLPRSTHPHLKYDPDNIVLLSRLFHTRLDQSKDPVTGKHISKAVRRKWWERIIGPEYYQELLEKEK